MRIAQNVGVNTFTQPYIINTAKPASKGVTINVFSMSANTNRNTDCLPSTSTSATVPVLCIPNNQQNSKQNQKIKKNVIKTLAIVTACFFICWIPHRIYVILYSFRIISSFGNFYQFTVVLVFTNCCINPFIYIVKYDNFKKGLATLFRCEPLRR